MSWKDEVDEIHRRSERAREGGGSEATRRQHERGRASARERIAALGDPGSFHEIGILAGEPAAGRPGELAEVRPAAVVTGLARIDGRPVVLSADDFTVNGAAYTPAGLKKAQHAEALAIRRGLPLVRLLEGGGASVSGSQGARGRSGYDLVTPPPMNLLALEALESVPVVCAALGPCAGYPAARLVAAHLSLMTRGTAQVMTGGPVLVERALGVQLDKETLGGWQVHGRSGVVDQVAEDEADAFRQIRRFLSYLPSCAGELALRRSCEDPLDRREDSLLSLVPRARRRAYKVRRLLEAVLDRGSVFEIGALHGRSLLTALARVAGQPVGVLANDPVYDGGAMTAAGARKLGRFVQLCDRFRLPVVSFVDEPGFMIGPEAEHDATIRFGMEALFAVLRSPVPWIAVVLRRAFGVALGLHVAPGARVLAWPSLQGGALPVESGVALAFRREIASAPDPAARRRELEAEMEAAQSAFPRAEEFGVHELIDPRETRPRLCAWVDEIAGELARGARPGAADAPRP